MPSPQDHAAWMRLAGMPPAGEFYERIIAELYAQRLAPGELAVDGGANQGRHSLPMADAVGFAGQVLAVEPIPSLAAALERRAAAEGLVQLRVLPRALGAVTETRDFTWVTGGSALSGLQQRAMPERLSRSAEAIRVPVVRLDEVLADRTRRLGFVKLDLEGGELHALQGAVTLLREDRPLLAFENGRETAADLYGYTRHEWFGFFRRQGYAVFDILGRPFGLEDWERPNLPWYFVAVPAGGEDEGWLRVLLPRRLPALAEAARAETAARPG